MRAGAGCAVAATVHWSTSSTDFFCASVSGRPAHAPPRDRPSPRQRHRPPRRRRHRPAHASAPPPAAAAEAIDRAAVEAGEADLRRRLLALRARRARASGETAIRSGTSTGAAAADRPALTPGKLQYIITMPEANHSRNTSDSATPSQRWTKMSERFSSAAGRGTRSRSLGETSSNKTEDFLNSRSGFRQADAERGAGCVGSLEQQLSTVGLDGAPGDRQAEACSRRRLLVRPVEPIEDPLPAPRRECRDRYPTRQRARSRRCRRPGSIPAHQPA